MSRFLRGSPLLLALALALTLLAPMRAAHASGAATEPTSRAGVVLAVICGFSVRTALVAPVPWAGIAALSCAGAFLDAWNTPDRP